MALSLHADALNIGVLAECAGGGGISEVELTECRGEKVYHGCSWSPALATQLTVGNLGKFL